MAPNATLCYLGLDMTIIYWLANALPNRELCPIVSLQRLIKFKRLLTYPSQKIRICLLILLWSKPVLVLEVCDRKSNLPQSFYFLPPIA